MSELNPQRLAEIEEQEKTAELEQRTAWTSVAKTHVGRVRFKNEDAYFNSEEQSLWAVADGMGGHSRGSFASAAVVRALNDFAKQGSLLQNLSNFEALIESAHDKCLNTFKHKRVGTTVAALFAYGGSCFCLWAGDSRVYRVRDGEILQMTRDHTVAEQKVACEAGLDKLIDLALDLGGRDNMTGILLELHENGST